MEHRRSRRNITALFVAWVILMVAPLAGGTGVRYGDIVMNNFSEQRGIGAVVFPHSIHRMHFRCNVCHGELGFVMNAGNNKIEMADLVQGQYCGACHNGQAVWGTALCDRCHVGQPAP